MIIGLIIEFSAGILLIALGLSVWKKQNASLLHDYHFKNVRDEDIPGYTRMMGQGLIVMGVGVCLWGLLDLLKSSFWWVPLLAGFVIGFFMMNKAQKKYNGSWFS
ncbi:MAG: DUF3784 domain-containing protein [Erysipelotrichaceae bacterium]|nr:DUF3784 domain-containing protein [Erysipelotrichaceae bacterium]